MPCNGKLYTIDPLVYNTVVIFIYLEIPLCGVLYNNLQNTNAVCSVLCVKMTCACVIIPSLCNLLVLGTVSFQYFAGVGVVHHFLEHFYASSTCICALPFKQSIGTFVYLGLLETMTKRKRHTLSEKVD